MSITVDPSVSRLLAAAGSQTGLEIILVFGHDPLAFDTAAGFAERTRMPQVDVQSALDSLRDSGVLRTSNWMRGGRQTFYWLSEDASNLAALGRLMKAYRSGPEHRAAMHALLPGHGSASPAVEQACEDARV